MRPSLPEARPPATAPRRFRASARRRSPAGGGRVGLGTPGLGGLQLRDEAVEAVVELYLDPVEHEWVRGGGKAGDLACGAAITRVGDSADHRVVVLARRVAEVVHRHVKA